MGWRSTRVVVSACVAVAVLLLLADLRGVGPGGVLRGVVGAVAGPPERALAWVRTEVGQRVGGAADERARIAELEEQLVEARAAAAAAAAGTIGIEAAREVAAVAPAVGFGHVPARVVAAASPQDQVRSVAIGAGSRAGVAVGLAVVAPGGLAGLVDSVAPGVATLRLVHDPAMAIPARVAASGEQGVFRGTGQAGRFELLDPLGRMSTGDLVVTLGTLDGRLPGDLPLGRISGISGSAADLSRSASVLPGVDDSTLDRVVVLVPEDAP